MARWAAQLYIGFPMKTSALSRKKNSKRDPVKSGRVSSASSTSKEASKKARRGEPLEVKSPKDRSPKQENL